jgi:hypothetical protein
MAFFSRLHLAQDFIPKTAMEYSSCSGCRDVTETFVPVGEVRPVCLACFHSCLNENSDCKIPCYIQKDKETDTFNFPKDAEYMPVDNENMRRCGTCRKPERIRWNLADLTDKSVRPCSWEDCDSWDTHPIKIYIDEDPRIMFLCRNCWDPFLSDKRLEIRRHAMHWKANITVGFTCLKVGEKSVDEQAADRIAPYNSFIYPCRGRKSMQLRSDTLLREVLPMTGAKRKHVDRTTP